MNTFRITAALLVTITIGLIPAGNPAPAEAAEPVTAPAAPIVGTEIEEAPAQLTVVGANAEQAEMVDEAIASFDEAGLEVPALQIEFYGLVENCEGNEGLYLAAARNPGATTDRITICKRGQLVILHELAHAWTQHHASDDTRAAFTDHWGLDNWNSADDAWGERAGERAAHTIAFTLKQAEATDNESVLRYICGYELLTGSTLEIHANVEC
jgi:hypothetical protein